MQPLIRTKKAVPPRLAPTGDDGIAMLIVILAILLVGTLALSALSAVLVQVRQSSFTLKATRTEAAAEAGLAAAVASIRSATSVQSGRTYGDRTLLPCWNSFAGTIRGGGSDGLLWSTTITYFLENPSGQSVAWRQANAMSCLAGAGTSVTPGYALISSQGSGPSVAGHSPVVGNRVVQQIYTFSTAAIRILGGTLTSPPGQCYQGSMTELDPVTIQTCVSLDERQTWSFTPENLVQLSSTVRSDGSGGMCMSASPSSGATVTVPVVMATCNSGDFRQRWGIYTTYPGHLFGHFTGQYNEYWCLGPQTLGVTGSVALVDRRTCDDDRYASKLQSSAGPGSAGTQVTDLSGVDGRALQWFNGADFGRCLDVWGFNVYATANAVYPCKQDPMVGLDFRADPEWNQLFTFDSRTARFSTSPPYDLPHCMSSPNTEGGAVSFATGCATASGPAFTWSVQRETGQGATNYTITDAWQRCLTAAGDNGSGYAIPVIATCTGSMAQKWNAPPTPGKSRIDETVEVSR